MAAETERESVTIEHHDRQDGDVMFCYVHPSNVSTSFMTSVQNLVAWDLQHDGRLFGWSRVQSGSTSVPESRNTLCGEVINTPGVEWMMMVDADMGFAPDSLDRMLAQADPVTRPIIGGLCFANRHVAGDGYGGYATRAYPTILDWAVVDEERGFSNFRGRGHFPPNTLIRAGATGAAFLLIHRSVLERIHEKYGRNWFTRSVGEDGTMMGEDVSFFVRCGALGIPLHVDTSIKTTHLKDVWINEMDYWDAQLPMFASEKVAVIVPVLSRPQNVARLILSLRATTGLATPYFVCDRNDHAEINEVHKYGGRVLIQSGTFSEKANFGYRGTRQPWLLFVGDDVRFHDGWLNHALDLADRYGRRFISTNDCHNAAVVRGEHSTHPLVARSYIDEVGCTFTDGPGVFAHEGYRHNFVDNEWSVKAHLDGEFMFSPASRVEHLHPIWTGNDTDDVYELGRSSYKEDEELFRQRASELMEQRAGHPSRLLPAH